MKRQFGIILLETNEIIIRIYEADSMEWKLRHYQSMQLKLPSNDDHTKATLIIESLADFLADENDSHISEWKTSSRGISHAITQQVASALGLSIENLSPLREQELLCKGIFTELW